MKNTLIGNIKKLVVYQILGLERNETHLNDIQVIGNNAILRDSSTVDSDIQQGDLLLMVV